MVLWLIAALLVISLADLLLLSRATGLLSRLAFIPMGGARRIEIPVEIAEDALAEAPEVRSFREAPQRRIDVQKLPWPGDQDTDLGATRFLKDERAVAVRTKWRGKRLPAVGRIDVRGGRDSIELRPRFTPSPLSLLTFLGVAGLAFSSQLDGEALSYVAVLLVLQVLASVSGLRRQLDRAEAGFHIVLDEASDEKARALEGRTAARIETPQRIEVSPGETDGAARHGIEVDAHDEDDNGDEQRELRD